MSEEPLIAVFVDFENLAIGVRDMKSGDFQIQLVLKRLLEKGRLAQSNAELVERIRTILEALSLQIASPAEVREALNLKGAAEVNF